jgi:hypothetical protein
LSSLQNRCASRRLSMLVRDSDYFPEVVELAEVTPEALETLR